MDKLKNIVNPGHGEVDDLLYDTGKKHQKNDSALDSAGHSGTTGTHTGTTGTHADTIGTHTGTTGTHTGTAAQIDPHQSTTEQPGQNYAAPFTTAAEMDPMSDARQHEQARDPAHDPAHTAAHNPAIAGTAAHEKHAHEKHAHETHAHEKDDSTKPKKEGGVLDKILHPLGHKDKSGHEETTTTKTKTDPTTSEHHDRHKHAAEGAAAGGTAAALASHEKREHDHKKTDHTEKSTPAGAVAHKHTPADEKHETTSKEGKPSLIQKILHPGGSKTEKDTTVEDPSARDQHHHGRDAALGAGALGAGAAAHKHGKHDERASDPSTGHATQPRAVDESSGRFGAKDGAMGTGAGGVAGPAYAASKAHSGSSPADTTAQYTGPRAGEEPRARFGAQDGAMGTGAGGVAGPAYVAGRDHGSGPADTTASYGGPRAGEELRKGHGASDSALGVGAAGVAGAAYAADKRHEHEKHTGDHGRHAEKHGATEDTSTEKKPSILQKILHPRSSKTEDTSEDPASTKEHHHHGTEAAVLKKHDHKEHDHKEHDHKKHDHKKEEHKQDIPSHHKSTTAPTSSDPSGAPASHQYVPAASHVARGDPLVGSGSPHATGAPQTSTQQPLSGSDPQHHYGRDAALGAGAGTAGLAYAAHEHNKDKSHHPTQGAATSSAGAPATTGLVDSNAYTRQEQPVPTQQTSSREAGIPAPVGASSAAHGSHGPGQDNTLSHHVHNTVTGAHSTDAPHREHPPHGTTSSTHEQDRTHTGTALAGGAAAAAASTAYAAHQHREHDHGKDELSHHIHNGVTGTGSPGAPPAARQAASTAYSGQGASGVAGSQGVGNSAYSSQPASNVPHTSTERDTQHHHGKETAAGAAGAAGLAHHEHKKHDKHEESTKKPEEKKESTISKIMDKILHPGSKSDEQKENTSPEHSQHAKATGGATVPSASTTDSRTNPGAEGSVGQQAQGVPADQKLHTQPEHKEHSVLRQLMNPGNDKADSTRFGTTASTEKPHDSHTGRDAALGTGVVGAGVAAHEHQKHQHEGAPTETGTARTGTTSSIGSSTGPADKTQGPHKSNIANVLDPRVTPDFQAQREHKEERQASQTSTGANIAGGASLGSSVSEGPTSGTIAPQNTTTEANKYPGVPEAKHPAAVGEGSGIQSDNPYTAKPVDPRVNMPGSYPGQTG